MFCEVYVQSAAHIDIFTIDDLFKINIILIFFFNRLSILDPRSLILDPSFPVNLEVLLINWWLFFVLSTEVITCSKVINAFKR